MAPFPGGWELFQAGSFSEAAHVGLDGLPFGLGAGGDLVDATDADGADVVGDFTSLDVAALASALEGAFVAVLLPDRSVQGDSLEILVLLEQVDGEFGAGQGGCVVDQVEVLAIALVGFDVQAFRSIGEDEVSRQGDGAGGGVGSGLSGFLDLVGQFAEFGLELDFFVCSSGGVCHDDISLLQLMEKKVVMNGLENGSPKPRLFGYFAWCVQSRIKYEG